VARRLPKFQVRDLGLVMDRTITFDSSTVPAGRGKLLRQVDVFTTCTGATWAKAEVLFKSASLLRTPPKPPGGH
jgi:hypothetical protein